MIGDRENRNIFYRLITDSGDSPESRRKKIILVIMSLAMSAFSVIWGLLYYHFGAYVAAAIPFSYSALSIVAFIIFLITRRFAMYRFSQLVLPLLLPFFLTMALGGFRSSSMVIIWSVTSPLGALFFSKRKEAYLYFLAFVSLVLISLYMELGGIKILPTSSQPLPEPMISIFYGMNAVVVLGLAFYLMSFFVAQREKAYDMVRIEREKAEDLLINILPEEIATILKNEKRTIADHCDEVTIIFADIMGFTPLSEKMKPRELVELLNEVFSYLDDLTEKYGIEKIKTIGDCYMAAAGLPQPRKDHAQVMVRMALEACEYFQQHDFRGHRLVFRMGINSGSVVAGVIGRRKFIYDLWGDAVNTASRMESHGTGGCIQITEATFDLIKNEFECTALGTINIKGKGEMPVWHVEKEKTR